MNRLAFASPAATVLRTDLNLLRITIALFLFLSAFLGNRVSAQTVYGSISGLVKDSSGAVVPGASVAVSENGTATSYKTVTNGAGSYRVSFLKPGSYFVHVERPGFAPTETLPLDIVLNQDAIIDVVLKAGANQVVSVTAAGSSLNDTNPQVGGQLVNSELVDLPESTSSKGANEFLITKAFAGASSTSQNYSNVNNLSLGGGRPVTNPIIIDGLPSNMGTDGTYGLIPTPDSTEELQVLTAPFSAQYGQSGGGAILTTTKSGTDQFHGSAFEEYNSQKFTALGYFQPRTTVLPPTSFNYFGGSVGGPVWLPRIVDGRTRRLYFFTDWEYTRNNSLDSVNADVPTEAERNGDFSGPLPNGTTQAIGDPNTTVVSPNGKFISRSMFQGNVIPLERRDPVGMSIVSYFPMPNSNCTSTQYNYCVNLTAHTSYLYNADRVDYNATDYDHIWAKFSRDGPRNQPVPVIPNAANNSAYSGWTDDHYETSWSHIFSPNISNEARFGYVSEVNFATPVPIDASAVGLKGVILNQFPSIATSLFPNLGAGSYSRTRDGHYILNDAMILELGRHNLSVGGEFMRYAYSVYSPGVLPGSYSFTGMYTSMADQGGFGLADLELGLVSSGSISTTNTVFHQNLNYFAGYIQDDYRVFTNLTVNLGLRYEFDGPYAESHNNSYSFNPNIVDPTTGKLGGIEFAGRNGAPHSLIANIYTGILPRIGFNYRAMRHLVVRGGYGIYELPSIGFGTTGLTSASTVAAGFQSSNPTVTPAFQLKNGVPPYSANVGPNGEPLIPTSLTRPTFSPVQRQLTAVLPYLQEWQFGVQQDFGHDWVLDLDYEGNHGVHLPTVLPINQIAPGSGLAGVQSNRPYPQFLTVSYLTNGAASAYAALYATLSHRWSNGISVRAAYTWAHALDDADGPARADAAPVQNVYNLHAQWGTAMNNIPQRLSLSAVYAPPVGSGGKYLNHVPVLSQAVGHWKVSTLAQFQMGYPYFITQTNQLGLFSGAQYATNTGNPTLPRSQRTVAEWFNPNAFAITPEGALGDVPRAAFYGPGQNVWDLSLMRDIPVHERMRFTVRVDAHNAFNHPQFSGLNTTLSAANLANHTFGMVTGAQDPRQLLLVGRFTF